MKPNKILHINRNDHGGSAVVVDLIAKNLNKSKYEAIIHKEKTNLKRQKSILSEDIIFQEKKYGNRYRIAKIQNYEKRKLNIGQRLDCAFGKNASKIYLSMKRAYEFITKQALKIIKYVKIIRHNRINLVHTHSELIHGKPEIIAAKIMCIPCICHVHAYYKPTHFDTFFNKFVDYLIFISNDVANEYIRNRCIRNKAVIIHNGVDMTLYKNKYEIEIIRKELGVKTDDFLVCIVGRIVSWKGHKYFIKAISQVADIIPDIKGIIIGDIEEDYYGQQESYSRELLTLIEELKINEKIKFTGFRSDVPRLISAMDIMVHASSSPEPFGLVIIEGMAAGKPVIATAKGGVLDIIEDGINGILVPCKDSKLMAKAIQKIYHDKKLSKKIGNAARKQIIEKFTIEHQVAAIEKVYESLLGIEQKM